MPGGKPVIGPVPGLSKTFIAAGHEGEGLSLVNLLMLPLNVNIYIHRSDMELDGGFLTGPNININYVCHATVYKYFMLVLGSIRDPPSGSIYTYIFTHKQIYII